MSDDLDSNSQSTTSATCSYKYLPPWASVSTGGDN